MLYGPEYIAMATSRFFRHSFRFFRHYIPTEFVLLAIVETAILVGSFYIGLELRFRGDYWQEMHRPIFLKACLYSFIMQMSLLAFGAYQRQSRQSIERLALRIGGSLFFGLLMLGMTMYIAPMFFLGRGAVGLAVIISYLALMTVRIIFRRLWREHDIRLRVLILGAGNAASLIDSARVVGELEGLNIIGFVRMPGDAENEKGLNRITPSNSLMNCVEENRIDEIVLAADDRRKGLPVQDILDCKMSGVEVVDLLTFFERETSKIRLDILHPSWLYLSDGFRNSMFRRLSKWLFDITVVLFLLPFVLPIMAMVTAAILVENRGRGPVLYRQTRVTENGRLFPIYKFRSMQSDAEHDGVARWAVKNDARITRIGSVLRKYRLDELPQLFNILRGDMSFVGPRPERPEFVEKLSKIIPYYNERHRVKPGLTGWAQICYPYGASEDDGLNKLQYDLYYVKNYSIFLDALVLLQTAEVVLLGKGAH